MRTDVTLVRALMLLFLFLGGWAFFHGAPQGERGAGETIAGGIVVGAALMGIAWTLDRGGERANR